MGATAAVQGQEPDTSGRPPSPTGGARGGWALSLGAEAAVPNLARTASLPTVPATAGWRLAGWAASSHSPLHGANPTGLHGPLRWPRARPALSPGSSGGVLGSIQGEVSREEPSLVLHLGTLDMSMASANRACVTLGKWTGMSLSPLICKPSWPAVGRGSRTDSSHSWLWLPSVRLSAGPEEAPSISPHRSVGPQPPGVVRPMPHHRLRVGPSTSTFKKLLRRFCGAARWGQVRLHRAGVAVKPHPSLVGEGRASPLPHGGVGSGGGDCGGEGKKSGSPGRRGRQQRERRGGWARAGGEAEAEAGGGGGSG